MTSPQPTPEDNLRFNRECLHRDFLKATHTVTREMMLGFARAIGETNPLFVDEKAASQGPHGDIIAPPTFVGSFVRLEEPPDLDLRFEGAIYMAGQWVEPLLPIRPGDTITCTARLTDVYRKTGRTGDMAFIVVEHSFHNQHGRLVARAGRSHVRRR